MALVVIAGCGGGSTPTESTDSTTGDDSGNTNDQPTEGPNSPPIDDNDCGAVLGWNTRCYQDGAYIKWYHEDDQASAHTISNVVGSGNGSEFRGTCCEGLASESTVNAACAETCQRQACAAARSNHLDLKDGIAGTHVCIDALDGSINCGFDMDACLAGTWHKQTIRFVLNHADYWMRASCNNAFGNDIFIDDHFPWRQVPLDDPSDNPGMCDNRSPPETLPGLVIPDDIAVEDAGMTAAVTWKLAGSTYSEDSQDAELRFAYDLHDCPTHARCVDLAALDLSLPSLTIQGVSIQNARLSVYQVDSQPMILSSGAFSYGPGTLHAIMSASADGIPIMLEGANSGPVTGMLAPASGAMTLSGLDFDYSDSVIAASLEVDVVGAYTVRGPTAVIVPVVVPRDCQEPVVFRAATSDPDHQSLTHLWWVPGVLTAGGSTLDVVLAAGTHAIGLIAQDADGRLDATAIRYTRDCL